MLPKAYFLSKDVVGLARDLIGKVLCSNIDQKLVCGIITETEAYAGVDALLPYRFLVDYKVFSG